jgi:hypothetical protein
VPLRLPTKTIEIKVRSVNSLASLGSERGNGHRQVRSLNIGDCQKFGEGQELAIRTMFLTATLLLSPATLIWPS